MNKIKEHTLNGYFTLGFDKKAGQQLIQRQKVTKKAKIKLGF